MKWNGLVLDTTAEVYTPSEDSFLLASTAAKYCTPQARVVDVGTGSGVVALACARAGASVIAIDANPLAVRCARRNGAANDLPLHLLTGDLLGPLACEIDLVTFNPPYLPTAPDEVIDGPLNLAYDGGPDGNRVALQFAGQIAAMPRPPRQALVIHSSLSDPEPLDEAMSEIGYRISIAAEQRLPGFELLTVRNYQL